MDAAAQKVLGSTTCPKVDLYKDMAELWNDIDTTAVEPLRRKPCDEELIRFGVGYLKNTRDRGDYKELMSLSLLLLGAYPGDLPPYHVRPVG